MKSLENQVVIITGGSSGIGLGISEALASEGAIVNLIARDASKLEKAKSKINSRYPGKANSYSADITNIDAIKEIIENVYSKYKRLDIFVNNAGAYKPLSINDEFSSKSPEVITVRKILELDFIAPFEITHFLVQKFKDKKDKLKILTILSQAALEIFPNGLGYGTAKFALRSTLLHYEKDLKEQGINHIVLYRIYPGTVATEGVLESVRKGLLQNPTSLDSVVNSALDLLQDKTPTKDVRIGYFPGEGIKRIYLESSLNIKVVREEIIDPKFDPKSLL